MSRQSFSPQRIQAPIRGQLSGTALPPPMIVWDLAIARCDVQEGVSSMPVIQPAKNSLEFIAHNRTTFT
jgi:hypothetical protein